MQMMRFVYIILLSVFIISCQSSSTQSNSLATGDMLHLPNEKKISKKDFENYQRMLVNYFDTALAKSRFNGGLLVAKHGQILFEQYNGYFNLDKKDTLTEQSAFHVASVSKTFTSIAILDLIEAGKLNLNDSLHHIFPDFPSKEITIKMMLNHHSGLSEYLNFISESKWDKKQYVTNDDVLEQFILLKPNPYRKPNTRFQYTNSNFALLALVIEKITGQSYPDYLQQKYFTPLGMVDSYVFTNADSARSMPSYTTRGGLWKNDFLELTYGDKNIYTTPRDLLKWDRAIYNKVVLKQEWLDSAFTNNNVEPFSRAKYGLGFRLYESFNGKKVTYHTGRWHGFNAIFAHLLDEDVTVILLSNTSNRIIYSMAHEIYNLFGDYRNERELMETSEEQASQ